MATGAVNPPTKAELRRTLLQVRRSLPVEVWQEKSAQLCAHLQASPLFTQAQTVLAYCSFRQEPDLSPLFSDHHTWGFPRCVGSTLIWHRWHPGSSYRLQVGAYGILEPPPEAPRISPAEVDLLLVPAVAGDARGYRLGYGGGFYDRLFSCPEWQGKQAIALTFAFAYLPELPIDPWDQPLQGICTEEGLVQVKT